MQFFWLIINRIAAKKITFLAVFFIIFTLTYGFLTLIDFLPEPVSETVPATSSEPISLIRDIAATSTGVEALSATTSTETAFSSSTKGIDTIMSASAALPQTLTIDALDRTVTVLNPASRNNASLDAALLKGVIRHPDSATLNQEGNVFILGHSSYLPQVINKNYQALNGIQNLKWGDLLRLKSTEAEYVYRVEKVYKAKASTLTIPVAGTGKHLTLATCNSFGSTDDRYIVEASLIKTNLF